ncbi:MAG: iron donor protein CyaY [Pseudomonadota bacterium]|nr:MAG: iron donor protein CyaY [Pseudomonadota bacterium]
MPLSEREYDERALPELSRLVAALDALEDDALEAELASDILTIEFSDGTRYVINSHRAARQIWMAAERSAWHFDYDGSRWIATKTGEELWSVVEAVLGRKLGRPVRLNR